MPLAIRGRRLLAALLAGAPGLLAAQAASPLPPIGLGLRGGVVAPSADLFQDGNLGGGWRQSAGFQVGASATIPLIRRVAAQAVVDWGQTKLEGYGGPAWDGFSGRSRLLGFTGRLLFQLTPLPWSGSLSLVGGGGILRQTFDSPQQNWLGSAGLRSRTWATGVLGVQGRVRLNHQMSLQVHVEQYLFTARFTGPLASEQPQRDTRAGLGLYLPLGWQ